MLWIAPSEKDTDTAALEKRLWDAGLKCEVKRMRDEVRSGLTSSFILQPSPDLAVHGLEGEIKHGGNINSHYDDPHDATGRFDFVLANPPFNVNAVDTATRVLRFRARGDGLCSDCICS